jgi:hypothetical protein
MGTSLVPKNRHVASTGMSPILRYLGILVIGPWKGTGIRSSLPHLGQRKIKKFCGQAAESCEFVLATNETRLEKKGGELFLKTPRKVFPGALDSERAPAD